MYKMTSMSITRALAELKNLNARIQKLTSGSIFMSYVVSGNVPLVSETDIRSNWSSVNDIISRYEKIKFAILKSNSETKVKIGSKEYTVAEAIAMKDCIQYRKNLLDKLKQDRTTTLNAITYHQNNLQNKVDVLLQNNFKEKSITEDDIRSIRDTYLKNNEIKSIDPLRLDALLQKLESEYDDFMTNINFCLSESNAITNIIV
jgi:hypothetical protein